LFNFTVQDVIDILYRIPCVLIALILHEVAHGWVAYKLGDPTARNLGRLTLNPLKHLNPIGTLCMIFFRFGWANPVPVNMRYFKKPRRDMAIVALAGPVTNMILAVIGGLLYATFFKFFLSNDIVTYSYYIGNTAALPPATFWISLKVALVEMSLTFMFLNISLAVFNLIPINPLDGSRILHLLLPAKAYYWLMQHERYIMIGLMVLLWTGIITKPLSAVVMWVANGIIDIITLIPFFG